MSESLQKIVISLMILGGVVIVIVAIVAPESELERKAAQAVDTETVEIENCLFRPEVPRLGFKASLKVINKDRSPHKLLISGKYFDIKSLEEKSLDLDLRPGLFGVDCDQKQAGFIVVGTY